MSKTMKYVLIIWVFVLGIFLLVKMNPNKAITPIPNEVATLTNDEVVEVSNIPREGKYCFVRKEIGTEEAPYTLEESVVLNFNGSKVTGTKQGIQEGPEFINGYVGTLTGATITNELGDEMELVFDYEVDGSENKELEVYAFDNGKLLKKRWVLHEAKINGENILVPDYVGEPTIYTYTKIECINSEYDNVESYLRENVSKLSPVKAVLGGTWYVVSFTVDIDKNSGRVIYEDGHVQENRAFIYITNEKEEVFDLVIK